MWWSLIVVVAEDVEVVVKWKWWSRWSKGGRGNGRGKSHKIKARTCKTTLRVV